jgi:hypothetical protein
MNQALQRKVAFLESHVDYLETELVSLNTLLVECGFSEGIKTLKATVQELLSSGLTASEDDVKNSSIDRGELFDEFPG